jgi:L-serine/L-threonine ammonia-lyase
METIGADSLNLSLKAKEHLTLPAITSIANSLGARQVAPQAYAYGQGENVFSFAIPDSEAIDACLRFVDDERLLVEPACSVSIAPCYNGMLRQALEGKSDKPWAERKVVVVVCGGQGITFDMLLKWRADAQLGLLG